MHPIVLYEITKARTADLRHLAAQDAAARAARRDHRAQLPQRRHPAAGLARRVVAMLAAGGWPVTARPRLGPGCTPTQPCCASA